MGTCPLPKSQDRQLRNLTPGNPAVFPSKLSNQREVNETLQTPSASILRPLSIYSPHLAPDFSPGVGHFAMAQTSFPRPPRHERANSLSNSPLPKPASLVCLARVFLLVARKPFCKVQELLSTIGFKIV